ncbi:MAG: hypothetical protein VKJ02_00080 [Snowella sp.]|nr:hypothetical protein [Snowella sp.]
MMMRLNSQARKLLLAEVDKLSQVQNLDIQRDIVLKRLDKLVTQPGQPLSQGELEQLVTDMFPSFNQQVLQKAAKHNQGSGKITKIAKIGGITAASVVALSGLVWLVNLPYPMIRRPVARVAPILLLPSYLSMDRNYREAIAHVEQADQLVNQATSAADITLGAEKVKLAQQNLDKLPVWFLGYEPIMICRYMGCSWHFTFDEFNRARAQVGRMDARVFQEVNAVNQLQTAETDLQSAKQAFQKATTPAQQEAAIADWQNSLNQLTLLPQSTWAGNVGETKLRNYQQEFQQLAGRIAGSGQTQTMIAAAQQFANRAIVDAQKAPHTVAEWQQIINLWQNALDRLQQVKSGDPDYLAAQSYLADYTQKLGAVQIQLGVEQKSVDQLNQAKQQIQSLISSLPDKPNPSDRNQLISNLQQIIDQLKQVKPNTTAYSEAQQLLKQAEAKLSQL